MASRFEVMMFTRLNATRVRFLGGVVCCLLVTLSVGCERGDRSKTPIVSGPTSTALPMPPVNGKSLKEMGWQLADGQRNSFSQYNGSVLILDFYATWCVPCRDSIPQLIALQRRFKDQGLRVVGLNAGGPGDWPKVPEFARDYGIQYTLAVPDDDLIDFLLSDNDGIPQTFVFDRQGRLIKRMIGFGNGSSEVLSTAVESAVNAK
jgi:thiol-disulfide isomerase/thioredoxin